MNRLSEEKLIETCSKCGSEKLIPHVRILDRGYKNIELDLSVIIYEKPDALPFFKGDHRGQLQAKICGDCGHTELTVTNPGELWDIYQKAKQNS
ncbi:MAG: hypothetical protein AAFO04_07870 [Cyanobacteria bacterium J06592_8]